MDVNLTVLPRSCSKGSLRLAEHHPQKKGSSFHCYLQGKEAL
uniref:Uncharacterized protein n=1 Tax=Nelumbo nucifera TaxID=4432 RepID=A0A822ZRZ9_NELNU|nr:TPA_asm: hypothetical protein HUJ06_003935 [Nelumbo nucifera]